MGVIMSDQPHNRWRASLEIQNRARELRCEMTPAEKKLCAHLRFAQLDRARFRRQHAVGRFIVDFFCAQAKLVIEVDGDSHVTQAEYDAARTQWLNEQRNYRVLRFNNDQVLHNIEAVLERILETLRE